MAGRLAPASEFAGGHTLPFYKGRGLPILKRYMVCPPMSLYSPCADQPNRALQLYCFRHD
jgi:hypothetical protein